MQAFVILVTACIVYPFGGVHQGVMPYTGKEQQSPPPCCTYDLHVSPADGLRELLLHLGYPQVPHRSVARPASLKPSIVMNSQSADGHRTVRRGNEKEWVWLNVLLPAVREGNLEAITALLDLRDVVSYFAWRSMIRAAAEVKECETALWLLERMEESGKKYDSGAYGWAITACCAHRQKSSQTVKKARDLLSTMKTKKGPRSLKVQSYNQVISALGRCGEWQEALQVFGWIPDDIRTVVTYNAAMDACSKAQQWSDALAILKGMELNGPEPDAVSYSTVVTACKRAGKMDQAWSLLRKLNASKTQDPVASAFTYATTLTALSESGKIEEALRVYETIPQDVELNHVIVNAAVQAATRGNYSETALRILEDAIQKDVFVQTSALNMVLNSLNNANQSAKAFEVFNNATYTIRPTKNTYILALQALEELGRWQEAVALLKEMRESNLKPNREAYNLALGACAKAAKFTNREALKKVLGQQTVELFLSISKSGSRPDKDSVSRALSTCIAVGENISALMPESSHDFGRFGWHESVLSFTKAREWEEALGVFSGLQLMGIKLERRTWDLAILAAGQVGKAELAKNLLAQMQEQGLEPAKQNYVDALNACARAADYDAAHDLVLEMKSKGIPLDAKSYRVAMEAAGRGGYWELALGLYTTRILEGYGVDAMSLSTMLNSMTKGGVWQLALKTFAGAVEQFPELRVTKVYAAALRACVEGAQQERALELLEEMTMWNVPIDATCYDYACAAYISAKNWQGAFALLQECLRKKITPLRRTWSTVYEGCLANNAEREALGVTRLAEASGIPLLSHYE